MHCCAAAIGPDRPIDARIILVSHDASHDCTAATDYIHNILLLYGSYSTYRGVRSLLGHVKLTELPTSFPFIIIICCFFRRSSAWGATRTAGAATAAIMAGKSSPWVSIIQLSLKVCVCVAAYDSNPNKNF